MAIIDELMKSSTRLYASPIAMNDSVKRRAIEDFVVLVKSVIEARRRVMLELNVGIANLESVIEVLPCLRVPTVATLHGKEAYAVRAAVPRAELPTLVPELKKRGGTDIVVSNISQLVA